MSAEQITSILIGMMLLLSHYINYRATVGVKRELRQIKKDLESE